MNRSIAGAMAFFAIGVGFLAIGYSGQRAFEAIGAAFLFIGFIFMVRQRRSGGLK